MASEVADTEEDDGVMDTGEEKVNEANKELFSLESMLIVVSHCRTCSPITINSSPTNQGIPKSPWAITW